MSVALDEAAEWADRMERVVMFREGGNRKSARTRLAREVDVPASYLTTIRHKQGTLKGVDGDAYRNLFLAWSTKYRAICEAVEGIADRIEAHNERIEDEIDKGRRARAARAGSAGAE